MKSDVFHWLVSFDMLIGTFLFVCFAYVLL